MGERDGKTRDGLVEPYRSFERLLVRLEGAQPIAAAAVTMGISFLLIFTSFVLQLNAVPMRGAPHKDVGYVAALNWSVAYTVCVPLVIGFLIAALRGIRVLFDELEARGMLKQHVLRPTPHLEPASAATFRAAWATERDFLVKGWFWLSVFLAILPTVAEWAHGTVPALLLPDCQRAGEPDWTTAMCGAAMPARIANLGFATATAAFQAVFVSILWLLVMYVVVLIRTFYSNYDETRLVVVPRKNDDDPRHGFQVFEGVLTSVLIACIGAYVSFYLARLWNVFLRTDSPSLWREIVAGLPDSLLEVSAGDFSSTAVLSGASLFIVFCIAGPFFVLRQAALRGRRLLGDAEPGSTTGMKNMQVWPISYLPQNRLVGLTLLGLVAVFFFRLGLLFSVLAIGVVVGHFVDRSPKAPRPGKMPWWIVSVLSAGAAMVWLYVVLSVEPVWQLILLAGAAAFVAVLLHNPATRYFRLASMALGAAGASYILPWAIASLKLTLPDDDGSVVADFTKSGPPWQVMVALVCIAGVFGILDLLSRRHDAAQEPTRDPRREE